jgi:hypothetical protein
MPSLDEAVDLGFLVSVLPMKVGQFSFPVLRVKNESQGYKPWPL